MTPRRTGDAQGNPASSFDEFPPEAGNIAHCRRSAIDLHVPARAFRCASGALQWFFAVSKLIFIARLLRKCFVLRSLIPAVGFLSARRVRFRSRYFDSWNRPHTGAENALAGGAANAYSCRVETHFAYRAVTRRPSVRIRLSEMRLVVVTRCPRVASAATEDDWRENCVAREALRE